MPPFSAGEPQNLSGSVFFPIFWNEEDGEVLSDYLFGFVTFDSLCTGVPTDYRTLRVQHGDCIVLNSVQDQAMLLFAVTERIFGVSSSQTVPLYTPPGSQGDQQTK